jgi:hypothetical protein
VPHISGGAVRRRISGGGLLLYGSVIWVSRYRSCALIRRCIGNRLRIRSLHCAVVVPGRGGRVCIRGRRHHGRIRSIILSGRRSFRYVSSRRTADQPHHCNTTNGDREVRSVSHYLDSCLLLSVKRETASSSAFTLEPGFAFLVDRF